MKKFSLILVILALAFTVSANKNAKDSIVELNNISQKYLQYSLDSSVYYAKKSLKINNNNYPNEIARSQKLLGIVNYYNRNWDSAIYNYNLALKNYEISSNKEGESALLNNIALVYQERSMHEKAIEFHIKALQIRLQLGQNKDIAASYNNLGNLYSIIGENDKAIEYFNKGIVLLNKETDAQDLLADLFNNLGATYKNLGQRKLSEKFHRKAYKLRKKLGNNAKIGASLMNIANSIDYQSDSIEMLLKEALKIFEKENYVVGEAQCFGNLANLLRYNKEYDSALMNYNKAIDLCKTYDLIEIQKNTIRDVALLYLLKGNITKYEEYLFEYQKIDNLLLNKEKKEIIAELETKYKSIEQKLQIEKLEKEKEQQRAQIYKIRLYWAIAIIFILTVSFIGFLRSHKYRQTQRHKRQKLEKQKLEFQNKVLRLQMNPHFIFNSLNSIQSFIARNNSLHAEEYLAQFSHLMRRILENSTKEYIPLCDDIETLETYLTLEKSRFENKFDFKINIDEELDEEFIKVPPMLAQPFVENSIIHGFSNINYTGLIEISYSCYLEGLIKCTIIDNGIGRERAKEKSQNKKNKSMGILITQERLASENKATINQPTIKYSDLKSSNGKAAGTKVELIIRIKE